MSRYTAQQFIDAIPGTGGIITTIAANVGCAWHTARKYIENYPTVKAAYNDECESVLDQAEKNVIDAIKQDGDEKLPTSKWYLKMKGGNRGYAQTRKNFDIDLTKLTDEQLDRLARGEDIYAVLATPSTGGAGEAEAETQEETAPPVAD